jgi:DNA-binding MarR family transcriptional regulator
MSQVPLDVAVNEFGQAIRLLVRRLRATGAEQGLSWTEASVLGRLASNGPVTTADLARAEGVKPQSMRVTVATLEGMGLVGRKPHPTDGRQVNIELTDEGAATRASALKAKQAWLSEAVARLDEEQRETLFRAGAIIKHMVEK